MRKASIAAGFAESDLASPGPSCKRDTKAQAEAIRFPTGLGPYDRALICAGALEGL
jgi:hypothetical protein